MKTALPLSLLVISILALASACFTPEAVVRIQPEQSENVFWHQGQPIAEQVQNNIMMRAAYSHATEDYLVFDIEVFNDGLSAILVSPEQFMLTTPRRNLRIPARNPEEVMLGMEIDASRKAANSKNAAVLGAVAMIGAAVAVASADNAVEAESGVADNLVDDVYEATTFISDVALPVALSFSFRKNDPLSTPVEEIPHTDNYYFWQDVALRRTTLRSGESTRGLVAFPRSDDFDQLILETLVENVNFSFSFEQRLYQP